MMSQSLIPSVPCGVSCSLVVDQRLIFLEWVPAERPRLLVLLARSAGYITGCWLFELNAISSDRD